MDRKYQKQLSRIEDDSIYSKFTTILKKIPDILIVCNCYLVYDDVREAFLIEYSDKLSTYISVMKEYFDFNYIDFQDFGVFVTKVEKLPFDPKEHTMEEFDEFLSYPCTARVAGKQTYKLVITVNNSIITAPIIAVICDTMNSPQQLEFIKKIQETINKINKYLENPYKVTQIYVKVYTIAEMIQATKKQSFDKEDLEDNILNLLYTYEFKKLYQMQLSGKVDLFSQKYKCFLLSILSLIDLMDATNELVPWLGEDIFLYTLLDNLVEK